ncbi:Myb-like DNA-binding domain containing protein [Tritrichomonas foetus]|uniref:Myb-like DNA-binding domain containing protein n=1 Tax=Tritrichomonas foetus TaxID=1144522 RepID=A0A1J4JY42_9EUKA|nr:Myb-like DNA-binding domain containing protein [Tritrichomonas foetus]|eukprot:OHT02452.1 Myb-like DNA-binding domain containing protein [Tritrichomonas foetus]
MNSPLVDIAMNFVNDVVGQCSHEVCESLQEIFVEFITNTINSDELIAKTSKIIECTAPSDRLIAIVQSENEPIPESPRIQERFNSYRKQTRTWNNNEDNRLMMAVHKFGTDSWNQVADYVGSGRTRAQCSQRWNRLLDPKISKSHWTHKEEKKLIKLVSKYGEKNWTRIASYLGNRSDVQCRYRYKNLKFSSSDLSFDDETNDLTQLSPTPSPNPLKVHKSNPSPSLESSPNTIDNSINSNHIPNKNHFNSNVMNRNIKNSNALSSNLQIPNISKINTQELYNYYMNLRSLHFPQIANQNQKENSINIVTHRTNKNEVELQVDALLDKVMRD